MNGGPRSVTRPAERVVQGAISGRAQEELEDLVALRPRAGGESFEVEARSGSVFDGLTLKCQSSNSTERPSR
jgi:hypothetical protein